MGSIADNLSEGGRQMNDILKLENTDIMSKFIKQKIYSTMFRILLKFIRKKHIVLSILYYHKGIG